MKFGPYLRDRAASIAVTAAAWVVMLLFIRAYRAPAGLAVLLSVIFLGAECFGLCWDYFRRKKFYREITDNTERLDAKYLLPETLEEPDFYEGKIICGVLGETCRSMYENVAGYRRASEQFREYIELWVHEMKLPVSGMMLMCHNSTGTEQKYLEQLSRMDGYIENVLYCFRCETAEKDYLIKPTSLRRAFSNAALKLRDELLASGVTIHSELSDASVVTDGKWLEYIIGQIISNSLKYFSPDREPEITVYDGTTSGGTELHLRDNGIGIPAGDLPYIFDRSFTGQNGRKGAKSTGMGLYIVRQLCEKLGHSVRAVSQEGCFTEIILTLGRTDYYMPD